MTLTTDAKRRIIEEHARSGGDTGSADVQIALLTTRIAELTEHLKTHKHDHASRRGLPKIGGRRPALLQLLKREGIQQYRRPTTDNRPSRLPQLRRHEAPPTTGGTGPWPPAWRSRSGAGICSSSPAR